MSKRIPIFLSLLFLALALWVLIAPTPMMKFLIEQLDNVGYDVQLRTKILTSHAGTPSKVAIVDIDDKSLHAEGRWPWPRSKMATLLNELKNQGATVVAFDMFFPEKQENIAELVLEKLKKENQLNAAIQTILEKNKAVFDEDHYFADALAANDVVLALGFLPRKDIQNVLPSPLLTLPEKEANELNIYHSIGYISSISLLMDAAKHGGFINIVPDNDGVIRYAPLLYLYQNKLYASLALQAVLSYLGADIKLVTSLYNDRIKLEGVQVGNSVIPTDEVGQVLIPFVGPSYTFQYFSATDILHHTLPENSLLGKIIFVGTSATGLGDLQATAIQNPFPGVEIQASVANGLLQKNFSYKPAWALGANIMLTLIFGLLATFSFPYLGPRTHGAFIVFLPVGLLFFNNFLWEQTGLVLSLLVPVILILIIAVINIIYGYLFESRKKERIKSMFGQYVPEKHIDAMLKTSGNYALKGEDREMSVLFADIRSFTSISEKLSASELVEFLNTYFTPMTEIIFKHKGTIDKYVGDMIMAFWGAPLTDPEHTNNALISALEMQAQAKNMADALKAKQWPEIKIGIGINSGVMSVGDMGSKYRRNYTVLGDNVNLASRVESLTKFYGVDIAVTENAMVNQGEFIFRKLDRVLVKGKLNGVNLYELICKKSDTTPELAKELQQYHEALSYYEKQQWQESRVIIQNLHDTYLDKKIYQVYLNRIDEYEKNPPPAEWNGVFVHSEK